MPEKVIRDDVEYIEYTPQEIDKIRLDNHVRDMVSRGRFYGSADAPTYPSSNIDRRTPLTQRYRRK